MSTKIFKDENFLIYGILFCLVREVCSNLYCPSICICTWALFIVHHFDPNGLYDIEVLIGQTYSDSPLFRAKDGVLSMAVEGNLLCGT